MLNDSIASGIESKDSISDEDAIECQRIAKYWAVAAQKRKGAVGLDDRGEYYAGLVTASRGRTDTASSKDRRQINKDLPRTFNGLPTPKSQDSQALLPLLYRILTAYIERGRALCSTTMTMGMSHPVGGRRQSAATTLVARGLLTGYPQGLNFLAGMSLLVAGASRWDGHGESALEETGFWLLALLLEDVLDPDFFGADVKDNLQMAYIGGLGMRNIIVEKAEACCPVLFDALGRQAFECSLSAVLDQWVLSLFIGCAPYRILEYLWEHLLLPSPYHTEIGSFSNATNVGGSKRLPRGLATIIAFTLAFLRCCGDEKLKGEHILEKLRALRLAGATPEDISLEAGEVIKIIREALNSWPLDDDITLLTTATSFLTELTDETAAAHLWNDVRQHKQKIADCAGNYDDQLMALARQTHFTQGEIQQLREEFEQLPGDGKVDVETFKKVVSRAVPEFPLQLCGRLFDKLDAFQTGRLTFVELVCGMSALSLGTMDEKLQVCFDLFDSQGHRALTLKDLGDLCTVLFRVALAQGFRSPALKRATTLEDVYYDSRPRFETLDIEEPDFPRCKSEKRGRQSRLQQYQREAGRLSFSGIERRPSSQRLNGRQESDSESEDLAGVSFRKAGRTGVNQASDEAPWRSMLLRLLAAAQVRTPGGPWLVAFEDFRKAAHMEPALLCLFAWCLPRPPMFSRSESLCSLSLEIDEGLADARRGNDMSMASRCCRAMDNCIDFIRRRQRRQRRMSSADLEEPLPTVTRVPGR